MFKLFKTQNINSEGPRRIYAALLAYIRHPFFYERMAVPDTMTGRFDLLLTHIFFIINRLPDARDFNQALFDTMFADMDQTLREQGVGDMGVPKHMKRMMKAFNGRMHAYRDALAASEGDLTGVLKRNLYATVPAVSDAAIRNMINYLKELQDSLERQDAQKIMAGKVDLPEWIEAL